MTDSRNLRFLGLRQIQEGQVREIMNKQARLEALAFKNFIPVHKKPDLIYEFPVHTGIITECNKILFKIHI